MTDIELWLIDAGNQAIVPVDWVRAGPTGLNRREHSWPDAQIIEALQALRNRGWLEFSAKGRRCEPLREDIQAALESWQQGLSYGLTPEGGAQWKSVVRPRWDQFLSWSSDGKIERVESQTRENITQWVNRKRSYGEFIVQGSERWSSLSPWQATYWQGAARGDQAGVFRDRGICICVA